MGQVEPCCYAVLIHGRRPSQYPPRRAGRCGLIYLLLTGSRSPQGAVYERVRRMRWRRRRWGVLRTPCSDWFWSGRSGRSWPPSVLPSKHRRASAGRRFGSIDLTAVESETHSLGTLRYRVAGEALCNRDGWQDSPLPLSPTTQTTSGDVCSLRIIRPSQPAPQRGPCGT